MPENEIPAEDLEVEQSKVQVGVRHKDYIEHYSNFVQCGFTPWDIRVNFGVIGLSETGQTMMTELTAVVVSPQMAKALVGVLNGHVKAYERDNGEIHMPDSIVREAQARKAKAAESKSKEPLGE